MRHVLKCYIQHMIRAIRNRYYQWVAFKKNLKSTDKVKYYIVDFVETILFALVFALIIRAYIVQTSYVPTGSMIPTLKIKDRLFVNKFVYQFKLPERGDIVVFESPHGDGNDYVKRCIGMPGERVEIKAGKVFINGKPLIMPGVTVIEDQSYFGPSRVPEGHYFVLGDNRGNSQDSRYWGYVPREDMLGKAFFTFWPFSRMRMLR